MTKTFDELVETRRTAHVYTHEEVPAQALEEALRLSLWVPNHRMTKPWCFVHVMGQARLTLAEIAVELKAKKENLSEVKAKALTNKYLHEGSLIFLAQKLNGQPEVELEDFATLSCSIQVAALKLWQGGYHSKWSTGGIIRDQRTYRLLKLDPSLHRIVGMLWAGRGVNVPEGQTRGNFSDMYWTIQDPL